jgi:hypothetical protein
LSTGGQLCVGYYVACAGQGVTNCPDLTGVFPTPEEAEGCAAEYVKSVGHNN